MRRALLILIVASVACENQQVTHPLNYDPSADAGTTAGNDAGPSFSVLDAGVDAGGTTSSSGTTGFTSGTTGFSGSGSTSGSSGGSSGTSGAVDAGPVDAGFIDLDHDGLDDRVEAQLARAYLPYLSLNSQDACSLSGIVYRAHPHPANPAMVHIIYDQLFEETCGLNGDQVGSAQAFAITVDPSQPPPLGLVYVTALAREGTGCQHASDCTTHSTSSGACQGVAACDLGMVQGTSRAVVYSSLGKHGLFTNLSSCGQGCFDACELNPAPTIPPLVNVGEPGAPLVIDLTDAGFITFANGWTDDSLLNYDPWDAGAHFGSGSAVGADLVDPALDTLVCP